MYTECSKLLPSSIHNLWPPIYLLPAIYYSSANCDESITVTHFTPTNIWQQ